MCMTGEFPSGLTKLGSFVESSRSAVLQFSNILLHCFSFALYPPMHRSSTNSCQAFVSNSPSLCFFLCYMWGFCFTRSWEFIILCLVIMPGSSLRLYSPPTVDNPWLTISKVDSLSCRSTTHGWPTKNTVYTRILTKLWDDWRWPQETTRHVHHGWQTHCICMARSGTHQIKTRKTSFWRLLMDTLTIQCGLCHIVGNRQPNHAAWKYNNMQTLDQSKWCMMRSLTHLITRDLKPRHNVICS